MSLPLRLFLIVVLLAPPALAATLPVVAAESVYGDIARQIGGPAVAVTSTLSNPQQDPHLFEAAPSVARAVAGARIVIVNGIGYDPWMPPLLAATAAANRAVLVVADLAGRHQGDNPHVWYDPAAVLALGRALGDALIAADPRGAAGYRARQIAFARSIVALQQRIAATRPKIAGTPVTATEPVAGLLFAALGLAQRDVRFQWAVMNDTEPSAADTAAFERDLTGHAVRLLAYNAQASDPAADHMRAIARAAGIPVIGVSETEPPGTSYQEWMLANLDAIEAALHR